MKTRFATLFVLVTVALAFVFAQDDSCGGYNSVTCSIGIFDSVEYAESVFDVSNEPDVFSWSFNLVQLDDDYMNVTASFRPPPFICTYLLLLPTTKK
jgi:hypothetical protein